MVVPPIDFQQKITEMSNGTDFLSFDFGTIDDWNFMLSYFSSLNTSFSFENFRCLHQLYTIETDIENNIQTLTSVGNVICGMKCIPKSLIDFLVVKNLIDKHDSVFFYGFMHIYIKHPEMFKSIAYLITDIYESSDIFYDFSYPVIGKFITIHGLIDEWKKLILNKFSEHKEMCLGEIEKIQKSLNYL